MTPKEKAKELFEWFGDKQNVKECAMKVVNEKIYTCWKFYTALQFPAKVTGDEGYIYFKKEIQYLDEVKQEIEKL